VSATTGELRNEAYAVAAAMFLPSNPVQQPIDLTATDAVDACAQHA
jgi:hypothetical protein